MYPDEVKIAISLTDDLIDGQIKYGLTSGYIKNIADQNLDFTNVKITNKIFIKESLFNQPSDHSVTPMIMVGPGTGIVPFIGFIQEREVLKRNNPDMKFADGYLYFGCRNSQSDFIYKDEIASAKE